MTAVSRAELVTLRSGDVVRVRPLRAGDAPDLARAYANLSGQSRYRRFFTAMPELPEATLKAATGVDHEIVGKCPFVRRADQPGTTDLGVTVVDAWQRRGLGSVLLTRLSERAREAGIEYFAAEVLAENRAMLALLPSLGQVESGPLGPVVTARVELTDPRRQPV